MGWATEGLKSKAKDKTILAATEILPYNSDREIVVMITTDAVAGVVALQYVDLKGDVLNEQPIKVSPDTTEVFRFGPIPITSGDYVRLINTGDSGGDIHASIGY
jgi:hypothetical protein